LRNPLEAVRLQDVTKELKRIFRIKVFPTYNVRLPRTHRTETYEQVRVGEWEAPWLDGLDNSIIPKATRILLNEPMFRFIWDESLRHPHLQNAVRTLISFRSGGIPLAPRLFHMNRAPSNRCRCCASPTTEETVFHLLFVCKKFRDLRIRFHIPTLRPGAPPAITFPCKNSFYLAAYLFGDHPSAWSQGIRVEYNPQSRLHARSVGSRLNTDSTEDNTNTDIPPYQQPISHRMHQTFENFALFFHALTRVRRQTLGVYRGPDTPRAPQPPPQTALTTQHRPDPPHRTPAVDAGSLLA